MKPKKVKANQMKKSFYKTWRKKIALRRALDLLEQVQDLCGENIERPHYDLCEQTIIKLVELIGSQYDEA